MSKYSREITVESCGGLKGRAWVDVYDVLRAFDVVDPALAHAIKKLLCPGKRGDNNKDAIKDLEEAVLSIEKAIEELVFRAEAS